MKAMGGCRVVTSKRSISCIRVASSSVCGLPGVGLIAFVLGMQAPEIPLQYVRDALGPEASPGAEGDEIGLDHCLGSVTDAKGTILRISPAFCALLGYDVEEAIGGNHRMFASRLHSQLFFEQLWNTIRSGRAWNGAIVNRSRGGALHHFETTIRPILSPDQEVLGFVALRRELDLGRSAVDHRTGHLMLNLENRVLADIVKDRPLPEIFESVLEHLEEIVPFEAAAIQVVDSTGSTLRLAAQRRFPADLEALLAVLPWGGEDAIFCEFEEHEDMLLFRSSGTVPSEVETLRNGFFHFSKALHEAGLGGCWAIPATGADGTAEAMLLLVFKDARSPWGQQRDFLRLAAHLLSVSLTRGHSRRVRETIDRKIRQSQRMEAIGTLAGGIAHDFNNILGGLFGFLHLATEDVGPDHPAREWLREMDGACKRARDLVQQVLTFSRTEESTVRAPLNLASTVKDAAGLVRASLPSSVNVQFIRPEAALPQILGDPTQIQLAVLNLCTNAWQAMKQGCGHIELQLSSTIAADGRDFVQLSVRDDGMGIAPEHLDRVFDPFFSTRPVGSGTGLGLSVVHGILKSHGGQVQVESSPGEGAVFHLQFPVVEATEEVASAKIAETPRGSGERILFIDDELAIVTWSRLILERMGYTIEAFTDPEIALCHLKDNLTQFDLVVTDLTMPVLSGGDVIRRVREWRPDLPVILTTGRGMVLTTEELKDLGPAEMLSKPIGMADLCGALRRALDGAASNTY